MQPIDLDYLFSSKANYREVVHRTLKNPEGRHRQGVADLAKALKVHTTFLSKVLLGKADLSPEQAVAFCDYSGLPPDQSEFFVDLVARDRASNASARRHYERRLARQREGRSNLRKRLGSQIELSTTQQDFYYASWLPQAIHMVVHTPGPHSVETLAARLLVTPTATAAAVEKLLALGLLCGDGLALLPTAAFVHTGKDSPYERRSHINWRQKIIGDLSSNPDPQGLHFSAVACFDQESYVAIRQLMVECLSQVKQTVASAPSNAPYVLAMDLYGL